MLDALHHAAYVCRKQNLTVGLEFLQKRNLDRELKIQDVLRAALEVLPLSRQYTEVDAVEAFAPSASDFEVLENLRRLAFAQKIARPRQLSLWE